MDLISTYYTNLLSFKHNTIILILFIYYWLTLNGSQTVFSRHIER